ncbi:polysaccharide pyruvyl transferase family protein [Rhizobium sp.]
MRILRISFDTNADGLEFASSTDVVNHFGQNFGNLAFVYASSVIFPGSHKMLESERRKGSIRRDDYDAMLFPAANNLGSHTDLGWLADLMEEIPVPTLIVGLGVQAPLGGGEIVLPEGSLRFIELIKRRKLPIGVRGPMTQAFLRSYGVENAVVTGCPSNFLNPTPDLGRQLQPKYADLKNFLGPVALNLEYFSLAAEDNRRIVAWGRERGGVTIFQSDENVVSLLRGDSENIPEGFANYARDYFLGDASEEEFRFWLGKNCRLFIHAPSWIDYLRTVSFSTGTRFHGNMLAMQAGTPALVLYHDQRTLEMSQTMGVPSMPWDSFSREDMTRIATSIEFDGEAFDATRSMLAGRLRDLAEEVGFNVSDRVAKIARR